jgi:hypothetical protein
VEFKCPRLKWKGERERNRFEFYSQLTESSVAVGHRSAIRRAASDPVSVSSSWSMTDAEFRCVSAQVIRRRSRSVDMRTDEESALRTSADDERVRASIPGLNVKYSKPLRVSLIFGAALHISGSQIIIWRQKEGWGSSSKRQSKGSLRRWEYCG